jgi:cytochrome oxidase assembly protein ShyY1
MSKSKKSTVPVTERAVIQRVNRKLALEGQKLRTSRSARSIQDSGRYYIVDLRGNWLARKNVDVEKLARELEVLAGWESIVD